jgi:C4-dicarboxylate-binding protein DctP
MNIKKIGLFKIGVVVGFVAISFWFAGSAVAADIVMKYHHDLPEDTAQHKGAVKFKELVESRTSNRVKVQIFPNNALGDDVQATQQMQFGAIQGGTIPTAKLSGFDRSLQLADLPFLFPSAKIAYEIFDSEIGDELLKKLAKVGLHAISFWESGFKQLTCNHKVSSPEDLKGRKVRVMESPMLISQFKALGAMPIPIAFAETYTALQQGVVECQENPMVSIAKMKFFEVQKYMMISNHGYLGTVLLFSKKWFDGLDPQIQKILIQSGREAAKFQREESAREYNRYLNEIKAYGKTEIVTMTPEQLAKFNEAVQPVYEEFAEIIGRDLMQRTKAKIKDLQKKK